MRYFVIALALCFAFPATAGSFVTGNTPLPQQKVDKVPVPAGVSTRTKITASDVNNLWNAAGDLRTGLAAIPAGPQGPIGPIGPTGATGITGNTGAQGPVGAGGPLGPTGLVGPQGGKGDTGSQGPGGGIGAAGPTGSIGSQGPIGSTGGVGLQGPQGIQGTLGPMGPGLDWKGPWSSSTVYAVGNAVTFTDSNNYVCATIVGPSALTPPVDTSHWAVLASIAGPQGPQGPTGPAGLTGGQGAVGPVGFDGATGAQGATGPLGAAGATGTIGATGSQGAAGPTGGQGPTGPVGNPGLVGAAGPLGPTGAAGARGIPGADGVNFLITCSVDPAGVKLTGNCTGTLTRYSVGVYMYDDPRIVAGSVMIATPMGVNTFIYAQTGIGTSEVDLSRIVYGSNGNSYINIDVGFSFYIWQP